MTPERVARPALLDVNVLIALAWPNHIHHPAAKAWFERHHRDGWATTPVSEAGFVRVSSNRAAMQPSTTPALAMELLGEMVRVEGHEFWVDDIPVVTGGRGDSSLIGSHRHVTDGHLVALAERHGGRLMTFDSRITRLLGDRDAALVDVLEGERTR